MTTKVTNRSSNFTFPIKKSKIWDREKYMDLCLRAVFVSRLLKRIVPILVVYGSLVTTKNGKYWMLLWPRFKSYFFSSSLDFLQRCEYHLLKRTTHALFFLSNNRQILLYTSHKWKEQIYIAKMIQRIWTSNSETSIEGHKTFGLDRFNYFNSLCYISQSIHVSMSYCYH